ncbi:MAG: response regulator transcription factor, partial [Anaerolineae bacterium]|nr:response regulator transcription factor [Anaerolineae bacterium]
MVFYAPFRLLVVDADPHVGTALAQKLASMGYAVQISTSGRQAIQLLKRVCFDVLVIDPWLPDITGQAVLEEARRHSPDMVIIVLTSEADLKGALGAIKCAVNGYLCKSPQFSRTVRELMDTLDAQLPRIRHHASVRVLQEVAAYWHALEAASKMVTETTSAWCADRVTHLELDRERQLVRLQREDGVCEKALTPEEMALLQALMTRPGCVLSWEQLAMTICPAVMDNNHARSLVRHHIYHLRRKIELDPARPRIIRTVRGKGYLLDTKP